MPWASRTPLLSAGSASRPRKRSSRPCSRTCSRRPPRPGRFAAAPEWRARGTSPRLECRNWGLMPLARLGFAKEGTMLQSRPLALAVPQSSEAPLPFVSVLVPVRNEALFLGETLRQLLEQDYDPHRFEVIVADGQSTDTTHDLVRIFQARYRNLHLVS